MLKSVLTILIFGLKRRKFGRLEALFEHGENCRNVARPERGLTEPQSWKGFRFVNAARIRLEQFVSPLPQNAPLEPLFLNQGSNVLWDPRALVQVELRA